MKVFNNLTNQLEEFIPLSPNLVTFYSCGPTVYDDSHIGHARSAITWDLLARYLKFKGYQVVWIRNITNVDDKIINRAKELNIAADTLSRKYTYEFWNDMEALNVSWPEFEPRATDYIPEMISFIEKLIQAGFAYETNGDVYFKVSKYEHYGQLKKQSLDELKDGNSRIDANEKKEDKLDFALWKAFPNEPLSSFQSPWGLGRPGWHIECSTMIETILNEKFNCSTLDIHAGGDDLIFPHHENECAQSECLTGQKLAKYWMHNGMVMINGTKMSKSLNNYMTIKSTLKKFKANTIRFFCLQTHYKKQINFTDAALEAAETGFSKLYHSIKDTLKNIEFTKFSGLKLNLEQQSSLNEKMIKEFTEIMDNDLGTPQALALLFDNPNEKLTIAYLLDILGFNLNLKQSNNSRETNSEEQVTLNRSPMSDLIQTLLEIREKARSEKDFMLSDKIRKQLELSGVSIKDFRDKPSEWSFIVD